MPLVVMKMGEGGFRPAYNIQYATDSESQVIVGAEVVTSGRDQGQTVPMVEQYSHLHDCERYPVCITTDHRFEAAVRRISISLQPLS